MNFRRSGWWLVACLLLLAFLPLPADAQTITPTPKPISDDAVNAVSRNLYCPVCQNTPLEICPTEACLRWREQVRELLAEGYSENQVRQYFIDHFGMRTVGTPTDSTSRLLTIFLPFGLIGIVGCIAVVGILRRRKPTSADSDSDEGTSPNALPDEDKAYRAQIESELKDKR